MESDLIRRSDALAAIQKAVNGCDSDEVNFVHIMKLELEKAPVVEATEVVFCYQCGKGEEQYGQMSYMDPPEYLGVMCEVWEQMMDPCDYCSQGISKDMSHPPVDNAGSPFDDSNEVQPVE